MNIMTKIMTKLSKADICNSVEVVLSKFSVVKGKLKQTGQCVQ